MWVSWECRRYHPSISMVVSYLWVDYVSECSCQLHGHKAHARKMMKTHSIAVRLIQSMLFITKYPWSVCMEWRRSQVSPTYGSRGTLWCHNQWQTQRWPPWTIGTWASLLWNMQTHSSTEPNVVEGCILVLAHRFLSGSKYISFERLP